MQRLRSTGVFGRCLQSTFRQLCQLDRRRASSSQQTSSGKFPTKSSTEADAKTQHKVDHLPISTDVKHNLFGMGITRLFEMQVKAFDPILRGQSFIGRSRTGTGKTIAYLLPLMERVRREKISAQHSMLIVVPTRDLCKQVASTILSLEVTMDVALAYGGLDTAAQEELVRHGGRVVVATPGRLAQLLRQGVIKAKNVRILVIDEADAVVSAHYAGKLDKVFEPIAKNPLQLIVFSASMPQDLLTSIEIMSKGSCFVDLVNRGGLKSAATVQAVKHYLCKVPPELNEKVRVLLHFLSRKLDELGGQCIVFVDSAAEAKLLLTHPVLDRKAQALHSESTSQNRDTILTSFANHEFDVLISTDVVARGLDFKDVSLVLQLRPPKDPTLYIHRSGRTGRAGRTGVSMTFYDEKEHGFMVRMREMANQKFQWERAPKADELHHAAISRLLDEVLAITPEQYQPLLKDAESLLEQRGAQVLATALALLDGRYAKIDRSGRQAQSVLSGKQGYTCLQLYDPEYNISQSSELVRKRLLSLLSSGTSELAVGQIAKTRDGWVADVASGHAMRMLVDVRSGKLRAPFEITAAESLPRLIKEKSARARRLPWQGARPSPKKRQTRRLHKRGFFGRPKGLS